MRKTIISLGAGVQSSVMALMADCGELPKPDAAIFSDTGWEPKEVYKHLFWLIDQISFPVYVVQAGDLRNQIIHSAKHKTRVSNPPFFTDMGTGKEGRLWRACTRDFKIYPIQSKIRELLGKKRVLSKTPLVELWIGISTDEASRMKDYRLPWIKNTFPLIDKRMNRQDCLTWFQNKYPGRYLPSSSCIGCPFHNDKHWADMKKNDPVSWNDAVEIDRAIRGGIYKTNHDIYIHRSLKPLEDIDFQNESNQMQMFGEECDGMCGT